MRAYLFVEIPCSHCGKTLTKYKSQTCRKNNFCSKECRKEYIRKQKRLNTHGYVLIYVNDISVLEHRYIMEVFLGRPLTEDEVVHHINGNTKDNRIENLQVMSYGDHARLHLTGKKRHRPRKN